MCYRQDGGEMSRRFVGWLEQMAADGYDRRVILSLSLHRPPLPPLSVLPSPSLSDTNGRRVILYVNLYNMPDTVGRCLLCNSTHIPFCSVD